MYNLFRSEQEQMIQPEHKFFFKFENMNALKCLALISPFPMRFPIFVFISKLIFLLKIYQKTVYGWEQCTFAFRLSKIGFYYYAGNESIIKIHYFGNKSSSSICYLAVAFNSTFSIYLSAIHGVLFMNDSKYFVDIF